MADRSNFSSDGFGPSKPSEEGDYLASCSYQPCIYQPPTDDYQSWHSFYLMQQSSQAQNEEYASLRPITGQMQQSQAPNTMAPYPSAESLYMQKSYSQPQYLSAGGIASPYGSQFLGGLSGVDNAGNMISPYDPQPRFDTHVPNIISCVPNPVSYGDAPSNVATSLNAATPSDWQQSQFTAPMQDLSAMQSLLAITDSSTPSMLPQSDHSTDTVALQSTPIIYMELEDWWSFRQMNRHINTKAPDGYMCFACKKRFGHFQVLVTHEKEHWGGVRRPLQHLISDGYVCQKCYRQFDTFSKLRDHESACFTVEYPGDWEVWLEDRPNIRRYIESKMPLVCPVDTCDQHHKRREYGNKSFLRHIVCFHGDILSTLDE